MVHIGQAGSVEFIPQLLKELLSAQYVSMGLVAVVTIQLKSASVTAEATTFTDFVSPQICSVRFVTVATEIPRKR